jgi:hypothetical protein
MHRTITQTFKIPKTANTVCSENYDSSSDRTYYLDNSLLIRGYQMGEISVMGRVMGFCKHDLSAAALNSLRTEFVSNSKILASF